MKMYNIICHDSTRFEITEQQKEAVYKLSNGNTKGVDINGEFIFFSTIARIEKSKRPHYDLPSLTTTIKKMIPDKRKRALESIVKGFKNHFKGRKIPENSQLVLSHFLNKIPLEELK